MKTIYFFSVFLLAVFLSSCYRGYTIRNTEYCYQNTPTSLSSKLNLHGYYSHREIRTINEGFPSKQYTDTVTRNSVFFSGGIFLYGFEVNSFKEEKRKRIKEAVIPNFGDGITKKNDTIKAHGIVGVVSGAPRLVYVWFSIIDSTTIKEICFK